MATFTKVLLSGSTQGKGVKVVATSTAGTTIHTTGTSASVLDEIHLFAYNSSTAKVELTIEWGGTSAPDDNIKIQVPSKSGLTYVVPGLLLRGNGSSGLSVAAFAASANVIVITGYVNRIT